MPLLKTMTRSARFGVVLILGCVVLAPPAVHAEDLPGLYVGAGVGQARLQAALPDFNNQLFDEKHLGYKLLSGIRPVSLVGAEVEYLDFGHPSAVEFSSNTVGAASASFDAVQTRRLGVARGVRTLQRRGR